MRPLAAPLDAFDRRFVVDVGVVSLIIGFLTAIHLALTARQRSIFAFDHEAVAPWTLLTSAYVHHDVAHLVNNLSGFLIAVSVVYWLCWRLDARRWFRATAAAVLLVLPVLVNGSSYAILGVIVPNASPTGRGFSGIVAGFVGFLFAALLVWIAAHTSWTMAVSLGGGIAVLMTWTIAIIYSGFETHVAWLSLVGIGFSGWGIVAEIDSTRLRDHWRTSLPAVSVGFGVVLILLWFLLALFPSDFTSGPVATNIFAHAAGFGWGGLIALLLWQVAFNPSEP